MATPVVDPDLLAALHAPTGYTPTIDSLVPAAQHVAEPIDPGVRAAAVQDVTSQSGRAFRSGLQRFSAIPEALYGAGANLVSPGAGDSALEGAVALQRRAAEGGPKIQSTADVHGAGDALALVRNQALMALPDVALALAGGGIGGGLVKGAASRAGLRAAEELAARQATKSGATEVAQGAVDRAASRLVPAALDAAEPAVAAGRAAGTVAGQYPSVVASSVEGAPDASGKLVGGLKGASSEDTAKILLGDLGAAGIGALPEIRLLGRLGGTAAQEAIQKNAQAILPRIAKEAGIQGGLGAATGLAQTAAQYAAHKWVNDHVDLMSPTAFQSYLDSAVAGGALGAGLGGATEGGAAIGARLGSLGEGGRTEALDGLRSTIKNNLSRFAQAKDAAYSKAKGTYDAFFNKQEGAPEEGTPVDGSAVTDAQTPVGRAVDLGTRVGEGAASIHKAATDLFDRINQHLTTDEGRAAVKDTFANVAEPLQAGLKATIDAYSAALAKAKTPEGQQDVQKAYGKVLGEHVDAETPDATASFQDHVNRLDDEDQLDSRTDATLSRISDRFESGQADALAPSDRAPTTNPIKLGSKLQDQLATIVPTDSPLWSFPEAMKSIMGSAEKMFTGDELTAKDHANIDALRRYDPDKVSDWEATAPEVAKMQLFNKAHADAYDESNARPDNTALGDELQRALKARNENTIDEPAAPDEDTGADPAQENVTERAFGDVPDKALTDRVAQADVGSDEHTALQGELRQRLLKDGDVFTENRSSQKARDFWATKDPTKNANTIGIEPTKLSGGAVRQRALQLDNLISKKLAEPDNKGKGPNVALGQVLGDLYLAGVKINPDTITPGKFYTTAKGDAYYLSPKEAAAIRAGLKKPGGVAAIERGDWARPSSSEPRAVKQKGSGGRATEVDLNARVQEHQGADDNRVEGPERVTRKPPPATQEAIAGVEYSRSPYDEILNDARKTLIAKEKPNAAELRTKRAALEKRLAAAHARMTADRAGGDKFHAAETARRAHDDLEHPTAAHTAEVERLEREASKTDFSRARAAAARLENALLDPALKTHTEGVELAQLKHDTGVKIGTAELAKQRDSSVISERTYGVELRRLNDPASGESTRYLRNAQRGKYDSFSVRETPRDDATPTPEHEETQELRDNLEARYRKLNESEGKARAISDKELKLTAKSLDAKWREGGEARKSMTDIERKFLSDAYRAGLVEPKEGAPDPNLAFARQTRNQPENPRKTEEGRVTGASGVGEALKQQAHLRREAEMQKARDAGLKSAKLEEHMRKYDEQQTVDARKAAAKKAQDVREGRVSDDAFGKRLTELQKDEKAQQQARREASEQLKSEARANGMSVKDYLWNKRGGQTIDQFIKNRTEMNLHHRALRETEGESAPAISREEARGLLKEAARRVRDSVEPPPDNVVPFKKGVESDTSRESDTEHLQKGREEITKPSGVHNTRRETDGLNALLKKMGIKEKVRVESLPKGETKGGDYTTATGRIRINDDLHGAERLEVIAHELGHHIVRSELAKAMGIDIKELAGRDRSEIQALLEKHLPPEISADFKKWMAGQDRPENSAQGAIVSRKGFNRAMGIFERAASSGIKVGELTADSHAYLFRFEEYIADHVSRALTQTDSSPVGKFFKGIADKLKLAYDSLFRGEGGKTFEAAPSVEKWVQSLFDRTTHDVSSALDIPVTREQARTGVEAGLHAAAETHLPAEPPGTPPRAPGAGAPPPNPSPKGLKSMKDFIRYRLPNSARQILDQALSRGKAIRALNEIYKDSPNALKAMRDPSTGLESRIAYAYLARERGLFKSGPRATSALKNLGDDLLAMANLAGTGTFAERIFNDIANGRIENLRAAGKDYDVKAREAAYRGKAQAIANDATAAYDKVVQPLRKAFTASIDRMRQTGVPAIRRIGAMLQRHSGEAGEDPGMLPAITHTTDRYMRSAGKVFGDLTDREQLHLLTALQRHETTHQNPKVQAALGRARALFDQLHEYGTTAGVFEAGQKRENYAPIVMDLETPGNQGKLVSLLSDPKWEPEIRKALSHVNPKTGKREPAKGDIKKLINRMAGIRDADAEPVEREPSDPGFRGKNFQLMHFIYDKGTPADIKAFADLQTKSPADIFSRYVQPLVREAEFTRRFGQDGVKLTEAFAEAKKQGATDAQIEQAQNAVDGARGQVGLDGSPVLRKLLGKDLADRIANPTTKKGIAYAQTYQNARLLPLAVLSSLVDPMGIAVRTGGDFKTAWTGFKAGMKSLVNKQTRAEMQDMLQRLGSADDFLASDILNSNFGTKDEGGARHINDFIFKANGLAQWTKATRFMALISAHGFLQKHSAGTSAVSKRYLDELGLRPGDVQSDGKNVKVLTDAERIGASPSERARDDRVRNALLRFVDESVLRPTSQQAPNWFADPYVGLVTQYKHFAYAIQDQIGKRIAHEIKNGNMKALIPAMTYVPIIIASELLRGGIQYGAGGNPNRKDWGPENYAGYALDRSGLLGPKLAFQSDAVNDAKHGNLPGTSFLGPTAQQGLDVARGRGSIESALPAEALYRHWNDGAQNATQHVRPG